MLLRVLGPLEVSGGDGPIALPATKPRVLLAALAIQRGRPRAADELIDALWVSDAPVSAPKLLQVYVSQLRKVLPAGVRIATDPAGYRLEVQPTEVDADRFERLLVDGREALAGGNAALAASILRRALELWRGPAFSEVRYEEFAREEAERLEGLRRLAVADRLDADLRLGRHAEVLGELRGSLGADPTDERTAGLTMLAAYRVSGPADALAVYETVRRALDEELGEAPGPELDELRERIARRDPALAADAPVAASADGATLPAPPNPLVGRHRELAELRELLGHPTVRLLSLTGAGGSGKSRLALELARTVEGSFANGATLVELASLREAALVLPTIARSLDLDPGTDALAALSAALGGREQLLLLDNVEHLRSAAPELVRLLAAAPRVVIVVTTRVVLHVSGEHVYPVAPLGEDDAVELFAARAAAVDPSFKLDAAARPIAASICHRLDGLPLPIELAAARVRALGLRTLDARLASRLSVLTGGPRDLPARQQTLRETLAWSVNLLEPRGAEVLAAMAVFPSGCSLESATLVAGADDDALVSLVDHHLVQALDLDGDRRYRLLETVREYAYDLLGDRRADRESALLDWVLTIVERADLMGDAGPMGAAIHVLDVELDTLRDAVRHAARDEDPTRELELVSGVWRFWWIRGYLAEGRAILEGIIARRGLVPTRAGIRTARAAASIAWSLGDTASARDMATRALEVAEAIDDRLEQHALHNLLGVLAIAGDDLAEAERHLTEAIATADADGRRDLAMTATTNLSIVYLSSLRLDEARDALHEVLAYRTTRGHTEGIGFARLNLGEVEFAAERLDDAEGHFAGAADVFRTVGFQARWANALQGLAAVEARTDRHESAARRLGTAAALLGDAGWGADGTALAGPAIEATRAALGDEAFERLFREGAASATAGGAG